MGHKIVIWYTVILLCSSLVLYAGAKVSDPSKDPKSSSHTSLKDANSSGGEKKNILFLLPLSSKSHKNVFEPLIRALADKGHEITVIAATFSKGMPSNVREIVIMKDEEIFDLWDDPLESRKNGKFAGFFMDLDFANKVCDAVYTSAQLQNLLKTHKNKFDLIYIDLILNQCFYGLLTYFGAPVITLATLPPWDAITSGLGTRLPPSFIPVSFFDFPEKMTFLQRLQNSLITWIIPTLTRVQFLGKAEEMYRKHLGSHYPSIEEIEGNASMMFTNSHFSLNPKMPLLPDIVEVGGMHLRQGKPLPKHLEAFLADAEHGFILFSLGSIVRPRSMPEETRKTFLRVFSKLKQKVIWKWETDSMPDLPPNVKVSNWLPQQDILAHPKIKLFMSHGGLLSIQEAVYHGTPVLGIPVFGDQDINVKKLVSEGFGLFQEILEVKEDELLEKINTIISEPRFTERSKQVAKIMRDQPQPPLDRAIYWSEYVMRHNGCPHLRSPARDLNWITYHSFDVIAFVVSVFFIIIWLFLWICRRIFCCKRSNKKTKAISMSKKKVN